MPKLHYPTPDEVRWDKPLDERVWFQVNQRLLIYLANTDTGRDLLCIDKLPYPVVSMRKNVVKFYLGQWDGKDHWLSDFRVGAKWGNVIRYRWGEVKKALDRINLVEIMGWPSIKPLPGVSRLRPSVLRTNFYPDPHPESTSVDGDVGRLSVDEAFNTIKAGAGTAADDAGGGNAVPRLKASTTSSQYAHMVHLITLFDTSAIGGDTKESGTFSFVVSSSVVDNFDTALALVTSNPTSQTALQNSDYLTLGTTRQVDTDADYTTITANNATYNDMTLNSTGLGNVTTGGVTEFGCVTNHFIDGAPTWASDTDTYLSSFVFADTSGTDKDPKLAVVHAMPSDQIFAGTQSLGERQPMLSPPEMRAY
jgi:hypothetical protein